MTFAESSQRGQDTVEWAGALLVVGLVVAIVVQTGLAGAVGRGVVCNVNKLLSPGGQASCGSAGHVERTRGKPGAPTKTPRVRSPHDPAVKPDITAARAAARPKDCHKLRIVLSPSSPNVSCLGTYSTVSLQLTFHGYSSVLAWGEEMRYYILRAAAGGSAAVAWRTYQDGRPMTGKGCQGGYEKDRQIYHGSGCVLPGGHYYTFEFNFEAVNLKTHTVIDVTDVTRFYLSSIGNPT